MGQAKRRGTFEQRLAAATPKREPIHSHKTKLDMSPGAVNHRRQMADRNHLRGTKHQIGQTIYIVQSCGAWKRMTPRNTKANRAAEAKAA